MVAVHYFVLSPALQLWSGGRAGGWAGRQAGRQTDRQTKIQVSVLFFKNSISGSVCFLDFNAIFDGSSV